MTDSEQIPGLPELGRRLREARKRKGLTVEAVGEKIKVAPRFLEAVEEGDLSIMPAAVYAKGFVRSYCRFLGIDEGPILSAMERAGIREPAPGVMQNSTPVPPRRFDVIQLKRMGIAAAMVLLAGVAVGLLVKGGVSLWRYSERTKAPPSPFDTKAEPGKKKPARRVTRQSAAVYPAAQAVAVSVSAFQDCWIQYQLDARVPKETLMKPGESLDLKGKEKVRILIGNAGGVSVVGPGGPVKMPSKPGRVSHLLFTEKGTEKLEVPESPSSTVAESSTVFVP